MAIFCVFPLLWACSDDNGKSPDGDKFGGDGEFVWIPDGDLDGDSDADPVETDGDEDASEGAEAEDASANRLEIEISGDLHKGVYPVRSQRISCYVEELFPGAQLDVALLTDESDVPVVFFAKNILDMDFSAGPVESPLSPLDLAVSFSMTDPDDYYECVPSPDCTVLLDVNLDEAHMEGSLACPALVYSLDERQCIEDLRASFGCRLALPVETLEIFSKR